MRIEYKIVALSAFYGLCICLIDALLDREFFYEGTLWELLIAHVPAHELYIRASIFGLFIAFGVFASRSIAKCRRIQEVLRQSSQFLQTVIDGIPDGVMVIGLDHRIVLANSINEQFDRSPSDIPGSMMCYEVSHGRSTPCDGLEHPCPLKLVAETRRTVTATHSHRTQDGDEVIMEIMASPVFNEAGEVVHVIESFRDVTERQRAAEQLRLQRDRIQKYLDIAGVILVVLNTDGSVSLINKKGCEILGWDEQEILDKQWFDNFLPEDNRESVKACFRELMAGNLESIEYYENTVLRKDGSQRLIAWHNTLLKDAAGNITGTLSSGEDITSRRQTEQALRRSEEQFRAIFENALVGLYRTTPDGHILMANPAIVQMLRYHSFEELSHRNLEKEGFEHEHPRSAFKKHLEKEGEVVGLESAWQRADGTVLYVLESAHAVRDETGNILYYEGTVEDITERKRAEEQLQTSEANLKKAGMMARLGYWKWCIPTKELIWSAETYHLYGLDPQKDQPTYDVVVKTVAPEDRERFVRAVEDTLSRDAPFDGEYRMIDLNGQEHYTHTVGEVIRDREGHPVSFFGVVQDVTDRKKAEIERVRYQSQLRSLVSQLAMTEERERKEIEAALHDDLLQKLALCKLRLDELKQGEIPEQCATSLSQIARSVHEIIRNTRSLTFDLTSPVLYDIGLEAAIRDWLDREVHSKYNVAFEFEDDGQPRQLGEDLRVMLYRAVRELCTNVIKHSQAKRATVSIRNRDNTMEIVVEDDGIGMSSQDNRAGDDPGCRGGWGLFGTRERLSHFGARMEIKSDTGVGTRISIVVPVSCQKACERTKK